MSVAAKDAAAHLGYPVPANFQVDKCCSPDMRHNPTMTQHFLDNGCCVGHIRHLGLVQGLLMLLLSAAATLMVQHLYAQAKQFSHTELRSPGEVGPSVSSKTGLLGLRMAERPILDSTYNPNPNARLSTSE